MAFENLDAASIIRFLVGLLISTVVIYVVTFFMRQRRSVKLAFFAAIIGSIVYYIAYIVLRTWFSFGGPGRNSMAIGFKSYLSHGVAKSIDSRGCHLDHNYFCRRVAPYSARALYNKNALLLMSIIVILNL